MSDETLRELGALLRERREALDLTREELSRRVGVTPAYIFLIENARPRSGGAPSRPKRETLKRWTDALGMEDREASALLQLAGYYPLDPVMERHLETVREMGPAEMARRDMLTAAAPLPESMPTPPASTARSAPAAPGAPAASARPSAPRSPDREALHAELDATLERATRAGRWEETVAALWRLLRGEQG